MRQQYVVVRIGPGPTCGGRFWVRSPLAKTRLSDFMQKLWNARKAGQFAKPRCVCGGLGVF